MTKDEFVKIVCNYFNSVEDEKVAKYESDLNDPSWSNTDAYCYTPPASSKYAKVEERNGDTTIQYNEFVVFVRDMPTVNIHYARITFDDKIVRYESREEIGRNLAQVTTVFHGECSADFLTLSEADVIPMIEACEQKKKIVEFHIIDEKWRKNHN